MNQVTHHLHFAGISTLHWKSINIAISRNTGKDCILINNFYFFLTLFESLKIVVINMVTILIIWAKMATQGLLKIKKFWNKDFEIIISVRDFTNNFFSLDSHHIADMAMWLKSGNSSIWMTETWTEMAEIITSVL